MQDTHLFSVAIARVIPIKYEWQGNKVVVCKRAEKLKATKHTGCPRIAGDTNAFLMPFTEIARLFTQDVQLEVCAYGRLN